MIRKLFKVAAAASVTASVSACGDTVQLAEAAGQISEGVSVVTNPIGYIANQAIGEELDNLEKSNDMHPSLEKLANIMPDFSEFAKGAELASFVLPVIGSRYSAEMHDTANMIDLARGMTTRYPEVPGFDYTEVAYEGKTYSIASIYSPNDANPNRVLTVTDFDAVASSAPSNVRTCVQDIKSTQHRDASIAAQSIDWPTHLSRIEKVLSDHENIVQNWENTENERFEAALSAYDNERDRAFERYDAAFERYERQLETNPDAVAPAIPEHNMHDIPKQRNTPPAVGLSSVKSSPPKITCG